MSHELNSSFSLRDNKKSRFISLQNIINREINLLKESENSFSLRRKENAKLITEHRNKIDNSLNYNLNQEVV